MSDNWLERIFMEHVLSEEDFRLKIDMRSILSTRITIGTINEMIKNVKTKIFGTIMIFFPEFISKGAYRNDLRVVKRHFEYLFNDSVNCSIFAMEYHFYNSNIT